MNATTCQDCTAPVDYTFRAGDLMRDTDRVVRVCVDHVERYV